MRLLLDACVWGGTRRQLEQSGHDVVWAGDFPQDPGDAEILERAFRENRILVTLDKDFGELAVVRGMPHFGIVRLVNISARRQSTACESALAKHAADLLAGAIITIEPHRTRVRPAEALGNTERSP